MVAEDTAVYPPKADKRRSLSSAIAGTIGTRVGVLLLSVCTNVLTARSLGPHDRGLVAVAMSCMAVFAVLCTCGIDTANLKYAALSPAAHRTIVSISARFAVAVGGGSVFLWAAAAAFFLPELRLGLEPRIFYVMLVGCPAALASALLGAAEIGRGRANSYNLIVLLTIGLYGVGVSAELLLGIANPTAVLVVYVVGAFVGAVVLRERGRKDSEESGDPLPLGAYRAFSRRAILPSLAHFGLLRSQVPLVQVLAGSSAVGIYSVAVPLVEILLIVPIAISTVLLPSVANGNADWRVVSRAAVRTAALSLAAASVLAASAPILVHELFGDEFGAAVQVVWSLLPGTVCLAAARTAQSYFAALDRPAVTIIAATLGLTSGSIGMVILVPTLGATGAGLATSIGYFAYSSIIGVAFIRERQPKAGKRGRR